MQDVNFRCEGDASLYKKLLANREVQAAQKRIDELPEKSVRRQLLASSLRLTPSMSPKLHQMLREGAEQLQLGIPVEAYVYNSPQFNAACIKPEDGRLLLMFSSSLLEKFDEGELRFVVGHELGHHLFEHHEIPIAFIARGNSKLEGKLALEMFAWSRYAEISADRAGAVCANDANASARALFKLASGLTSDLIEIRIDEFAAQADEMEMERSAGKTLDVNDDWFLTHPFTPLRVKALQAFFQSDLRIEGGFSRMELESTCHDLMGVMSPGYLDEKTDVAEAMRRVLFAAGLGVIRCSGGVKDIERETFDSFFGPGSYSDELDFDSLEELLVKRIKHANEIVPHARKTQLVRDLCLLAVCDGRVAKKEREYLFHVGELLRVSEHVIEDCLQQKVELD